jgi:hypothetical protein
MKEFNLKEGEPYARLEKSMNIGNFADYLNKLWQTFIHLELKK